MTQKTGGAKDAAKWTKDFIDDYHSMEILHDEAIKQLQAVVADKCYRKLVFRCNSFTSTFIVVMGKRRLETFIMLLNEIDPIRYATLVVGGNDTDRGDCIA